ncbi:MAG: Rrf2 family transcriptional regulator [Bacillota bacterium]|nr:Rrf2 family transcriptional regulator [Bacillota bacterium]
MTSEFVIAVHAIVFLNHNAKTMTSEEIAENVCTNPARIRKVMAKLKKADLIDAKEGSRKGGYTFHLDPEKLDLLTVFDAVDEKIISPSWRSGDPDMECLIASGMADVMDGIFSRMDQQCKDNLKKITIADVDKMIFK